MSDVNRDDWDSEVTTTGRSRIRPIQHIERTHRGLLAGHELHELIDEGVITAKHEFVNAASIDVRLGHEFFVELDCSKPGNRETVVDLGKDKPDSVPMVKYTTDEDARFHLHPGDFCLAHTIEKFNLPNTISAMFILRSSMARSGLEHMQAGWADAGWHGSVLTLELINVLRHHPIALRPGMRIGQMVFFRHTDCADSSYAIKGNYNNTSTVTRAFHGNK